MQELTLEQVQGLLRPQERPEIVAIGPLRWFDRELRCTSRRCNSPTYCKIKGMPLCSMHALVMLNDMLVEKGVIT